MVSLSDDFEQILASSAYFSTAASPAMLDRELALGRAVPVLARAVETVGGEVDLRVAKGGRQSAFGPTAWLRIYSQTLSPTATQGYYLVYLFGADGANAYLSLNQGTSEFRSNHMRPIRDRHVLRSRATEARHLLGMQPSGSVLSRASISMSLGWDGDLPVGAESRRRIRNYEDANILAIKYRGGRIPNDHQLFDDLNQMLSPLLRLYDLDKPNLVDSNGPIATLPEDGSTTVREYSNVKHAGKQPDGKVRRAIELYAEDAAIEHLKSWKTTRVGSLKLGYDLLCTRNDETLHVEVKGTTSKGEEVSLTPNEVRHVLGSDCPATHALFILDSVKINQNELAGSISCSGGSGRLLRPWVIEPAQLTATEYVYRIPDHSVNSGHQGTAAGNSSP